MKIEWNLKSSDFGKLTLNPLRVIYERNIPEPNPEKSVSESGETKVISLRGYSQKKQGEIHSEQTKRISTYKICFWNFLTSFSRQAIQNTFWNFGSPFYPLPIIPPHYFLKI